MFRKPIAKTAWQIPKWKRQLISFWHRVLQLGPFSKLNFPWWEVARGQEIENVKTTCNSLGLYSINAPFSSWLDGKSEIVFVQSFAIAVGCCGRHSWCETKSPFSLPTIFFQLRPISFFFFWFEVLVRLKVEIVTYYIITVRNFKIIAIKLFSKHLLLFNIPLMFTS